MKKVTNAQAKSSVGERRSQKRLTTVLRVGLLSDGRRASFCVVKNISSDGVQIRAYGPIDEGDHVQLRVGDGNALDGRVAWKKNRLVGIEFTKSLDPCILLRTTHNDGYFRRRSSPRVQTAAHATLRTGGRTFAAELCDISTIGTRLKTRKPIAKGCPALLTLPDLPTIRGYVRWSDGLLSGFMFETPLPVQTLAQWVNQRMRVSHDISFGSAGQNEIPQAPAELCQRPAKRLDYVEAGAVERHTTVNLVRSAGVNR